MGMNGDGDGGAALVIKGLQWVDQRCWWWWWTAPVYSWFLLTQVLPATASCQRTNEMASSGNLLTLKRNDRGPGLFCGRDWKAGSH